MKKICSIGLMCLLLVGCAGVLTNISQDIREKRQRLVEQSQEVIGKAKAVRETYEEVRSTYVTIREQLRKECDVEEEPKWCDEAGEIDRVLVRMDKKVVNFYNEAKEYYEKGKQLNSDIETLEQKAIEADKAWNDVLTTFKNLSKIGVAVAL